MKSEHWRRVQELFDAALASPEEQRAAFVEQAAQGDAALAEEVRSLLLAHHAAGDFLEPGAVALTPGLLRPGERVGRYEVLDALGAGGMGVVYRARRADLAGAPAVALKLVRAGTESGPGHRRVAEERRILARLDHPGIARLLDGGTHDDGRPYFVMELIDGQPIDEHVAARAYDVRQRLALFLEVCTAVAYAHRRLVVHRDLKPSNILVTAEGVPKLLDFGIAKLLDPQADADATATALVPLTPEYASPEQVRGDAVTTAADVYTLGVLLYELLTGRRPLRVQGRSPEELVRVVCEQQPEPPSVAASTPGPGAPRKRRLWRVAGNGRDLRAELSGDLDTIVLTALRKEPERRYASVEALSDDVRRFLDGRPVQARQDSRFYRLRKLLRRHPLPALLAAGLVLSLVAGTVSTARQARRAERRLRDLRGLTRGLLFELDLGTRNRGPSQARQQVVERAIQYLDLLAVEARDDPTLQDELARAYEDLGDLQQRTGAAGALESYRRALTLRRQDLRARPASPAARRGVANSLLQLAGVLQRRGELSLAQGHYSETLDLADALRRELPGDALAVRFSVMARVGVGACLQRGGDVGGSIVFFEQALALASSMPSSADPLEERRSQATLAGVHDALAKALEALGDLVGARRSRETALRLAGPLAPRSMTVATSHVEQLAEQALLLWRLGQAQEAQAHAEEAVLRARELALADVTDAMVRRALALALRHAALVSVAAQGCERSWPAAQEGLALAEELAQAEEQRWPLQRDRLAALEAAGRVALRCGRPADARRLFARQRELAEGLALVFAAHPQARQRAASALLADAEMRMMAASEARPLLGAVERARDALAVQLASDPANAELRATAVWAHALLADARRRAALGGPPPSAAQRQAVREGYRQALALLSEGAARHPLDLEQTADGRRLARLAENTPLPCTHFEPLGRRCLPAP